MITILCIGSTAGFAEATTVYYQPTSYPQYRYNGSAMPQNIEIVHLWDGWINSNYYNLLMQKDGVLQVGGWGDTYRTYLRFDMTGLPSNPTQAALMLVAFPGGGATTTNVTFQQITSAWDGLWNRTNNWLLQPSVSTLGVRAAPPFNQYVWWGTFLTPLYNTWKNNPSANYGLRLDPTTTNNTFSKFESSRNTLSETYSPRWQIDFTPPVAVPNFKLPLPGGNSWLVTTEPGGYDCVDKFNGKYWPDTAHQGNAYFAIDFSWRNANNAYGDPTANPNINIPIKAAAAGTVTIATYSTTAGYYVEISHGTTGFKTRYMHMRPNLQVQAGQTVAQGQTLGYMWTSGDSTSAHLHFDVKYNGDGTAESNCKYLTMEGLLLKNYQTACTVNANGWALDYRKYYPSSNS